MGEYAEIYALEHHGIDISKPDRKNPLYCPKCKKKLKSSIALKQHLRGKHNLPKGLNHDGR